jgi:ferredoxin-NADP reductase/MOSC domain-containing protein YiiM
MDGHGSSLLSVNVGLPRDVSWQGRTVRTAVWKRPVDGPRLARRLNLDGDGQGDLAGHGGEQRAVFVYQIEAYEYWQRQLGRDDFEFGQFGENFTVRGLADDEVCIGDQYQVGEALFEVTQPRVTCFRVGIRMNDARIPALLVSHHRPGFYFRVLREGAVRAGDDIVRVARGPQAMTVAEVDALLYLPGHPVEQVRRALTIPALSPGWQASFRALASQSDASQPDGGQPGVSQRAGNAGLADASPPPAWAGFRPLAVTAVEQESQSVISLRLADPAGTALPAASPGQFVTVQLRPLPDGPAFLRSYSLSGPPDAGSYRISVKRERHGTASQFIHDHVRPGDQLNVAAPRGTFILRPGTAPVLLLSAGVGATPVLAMLHALAEAEPESGREVWWLHSARNRAEEPFAAEARSLLARLPRAHRYVCYSRPGADDAPGRDYQSAGRLSAAVLAELNLPRAAEAYVCGPAGFMADVTAALATLGLDGGQVRTEIFGARPALTPGIAAAAAVPPHQPAGPPGAGPEVAFARSGLTARWDQRYASLLDLAEACDVPVRWSCRTGVCHNCESGLLAGEVGYAPDPVDDPADGNVLICCAQPRGDIALDL